MARKLEEKEKSLVTRNISFSQRVFERLVLQTYKNQGLFGKGLNIPEIKLENVGKGENAGNIFLQCFLSFNPFPNVKF